ncbi:FG-GAP-like repeat-containing protein [Hahella aquimaris]|uniref:FG-GAP-like repeat-containing protein n=1 Tax=Hahella sp. HNIBRBA332 TaxID=3015983 RepID=UPI00273CEE0B|nr:FG-GAP-like repeat-containing protein [Hahella sp. HNIBRBA332]WLQ13235.1 FG-GAP-like repeat-containing protein [Hahella sp. HNIBRBA332]
MFEGKQAGNWLRFASRSFLPVFSHRTSFSVRSRARQRLQILLTVLLAWTSQAFASPATIPGDFDVTPSGAASYSIPIKAPPGIAGLTPTLSLTYNNRTGTGYFGEGWSLEGVSKIHRCQPTLERDGGNDAVDFDGNDQFCINGARLVLVSGSLGGNGSEYRTEMETGGKFIAYNEGTTGNGPTKFKVWLKNGLIAEYGYTANSRLRAYPRSEVINWRLNRISNRAGAYMEYVYDLQAESGEQRLVEIRYSGSAQATPQNKIVFEYEPRALVEYDYQYGAKISLSSLVTKIKTYSGSYSSYEYSLKYTFSSALKTAYLAEVKLCGFDNTCVLPTAFKYNDYNDSRVGKFEISDKFPNNGYDLSANDYKFINGDFNGDGKTDLFHIVNKNYGKVFLADNTALGRFKIKDNFPNNGYDLSANNYNFLVGDFNGDRKTDLIHFVNNDYIHVWTSNGDGTFNIRPKFSPWSGYGVSANAYNFKVGDFNGDGRTDLIHLVNNAYLHVWISNGDGTFSVKTGFPNSGYGLEANDYNFKVGDFNGDGRSDLIHFVNRDYTHTWLSNGDGTFNIQEKFYPQPGYGVDANNYNYIVGDFNGDGNTDLVHLVNKDYVRVWTSSGDGRFVIEDAFDPGDYNISSNNYMFLFGDFNADGVDDLAHIVNKDYIHIWASRKNGTFHITEQYYPEGGYNIGSNNFNLFVGDFEGDGSADIFHLVNKDYMHVWRNQVVSRPHLSLIDNGLGTQYTINYTTLSGSAAYFKSSDENYPITDEQASLEVVSMVNVNDGLGGMNQYSYGYKGLSSHLRARASLGFQEIVRQDMQTGLIVRNTFSQDFDAHTQGMLLHSVTSFGDVKILEEITNTLDVKVCGSGANVRYFPYIASSHSKKYDPEGYSQGEVVTESDYSNDCYGNLVTQTTSTSLNGNYSKETKEYNYHPADIANWFVSLVEYESVWGESSGYPSEGKRVVHFPEYDPVLGLPTKQVIQPGDSQQTIEYQYDHATGVLESQTVTGQGMAPRETRLTYDDAGRYLLREKNALGHEDAGDRQYHPQLGLITHYTDPNGQTTEWQYNGVGRVTSIKKPDGTKVKIQLKYCEREMRLCTKGSQEKYVLITSSSGEPPVLQLYDSLDRVVRERTYGLDGNAIDQNTEYNKLSQISKISEPYFLNETPYWSEAKYDQYQRPYKLINPDNSYREVVAFRGSTTIVRDERHHDKTVTRDALGRLKQVTEANGSTVEYDYDGLGNLRKTVADGVVTLLEYDVLGRKVAHRVESLSESDANTPVQRYTYSPLGEVITAQNADGSIICMAYDKLGRLTKQVGNYKGGAFTQALNHCAGDENNPDTSVWEYDKAAKGVGLLSKVEGANGFKKTFAYDAKSRLEQAATTINGETFSMGYGYDNDTGKMDLQVYPTGDSVLRRYNSIGYLEAVVNADDPREVYWQAESMDARGHLNQFRYGNAVTTQREYDPKTGRLKRTSSFILASTGAIHDLAFDYDEVGNLTSREDRFRRLSESFTYDELNRLDSTSFTRSVGGQRVTSNSGVDIALNGNIESKSGVGAYTYGTAEAQCQSSAASSYVNPYAVSSISGEKSAQYCYDKNGNQISGDGRTIKYNAFNQPYEMAKGGIKVSFAYGPDLSQTQRIDVIPGENTKTTYYVDGLYEKIVEGGSTKHKLYIGDFAVFTREGNKLTKEYIHRDNQGGVSFITDVRGREVERLSYDPWGLRRNALTWDDINVYAYKAKATTQGYTGHEHVDAMGLIHMGGRVYDPIIGRFLSADPIVQAPSMSQSFNRYSYVMNNPLSMTDPSGYEWTGDPGEPLGDWSGSGRDTASSGSGWGGGRASYDDDVTVLDTVVVYGGEHEVIDIEVDSDQSSGNPFSKYIAAWGKRGVAGTITDYMVGAYKALWNISVELYEGLQYSNPATAISYMMGAGLHLPQVHIANNELGGAAAAEALSMVVFAIPGRAAAARSTVTRTTGQLLQEIATRAERKIGGTGRIAGIHKHSYARKLLERYQDMFGQRGLQTEVSYRGRAQTTYGRKGSVRLDVYDVAARIAYDYKFVTNPPGLSTRQINKITANALPGTRVIEVNP